MTASQADARPGLDRRIDERATEVAEPAVLPPPVAARPIEARPEPAGADAAGVAAGTVATPPSGPLELEIVHASGAAAAGACIAIARDELVLSSGLTDRDGRVRVAALDAPATLYVGGPLPATHVQPLEPGPGPRRIALPDGAEVSGWVTVQGQRLGDRVVGLRIDTLRTRRDADQDLPQSVMKALSGPIGAWGVHRNWLMQSVTGDGAFRFSGLTDGETAWCLIPQGFTLADGTERLELTAPRADVLIDLLQLPTIRGRAVWLATGEPVAHCRARYAYGLAAPRPPSQASAKRSAATSQPARPTMIHTFIDADSEGRFAIPVGTSGLSYASFDLWLIDPDGQGSASRSLDDAAIAEAVAHGKDLGDIALRPARTVTFRVRDALGAPIEKAFATAERSDVERETRSPPTDAEGRSELRGLPAEPVALTFWSTHCDSLVVMAQGPADEHLEVTLERCASLEITVRPTSGTLPSDLIFSLAADQQAFTGVDDEFGPEFTRFAMEPTAGMSIESRSDSSTTPPTVSGKITYEIPSTGTISISCLRPAVPLRVSVLDADGRAVWGEEIITLARGESRALDITVPGESGH